MVYELAKTLLWWLVLAPVAFLAGSLFRVLIREKDVLLRGILYYAIGFAFLSYLVVFLSALGLLRPFFVAFMLLGLGLFAFPRGREWFGWVQELAHSFHTPKSSRIFPILNFFTFLSLIALLAGTLTPEIGGDALCYQLNLPKVFLRESSLQPNYYDYNSYFPLLMNNLYLIGLALAGAPAAKLFHLFCGGLLFLALWRVTERETKKPVLAYFIALVFWVTPTVYNLMSSAYVDVGLAFYVFLGAVMFFGALKTKDMRTFFLSGLLLGCASSVKYLGAVPLAVLLALAAVESTFSREIFQFIKNLGACLAGFLVTGGYWLLRNFFATGNPIFPYFGSFLGLDDRPPAGLGSYGVGKGFFDFLFLFWNMFNKPADFGTVPTRISVFYIVFFIFLFFTLLRVPRARRLAWGTLLFLLVMFFLSQADRWILPVLPLVAYASAPGMLWVHESLGPSVKGWLSKAAAGFGLCLLGFYVMVGVYHYRYALLPFLGIWTPAEYLKKMERTLPVATWANQNLPPNAKILLEFETRQFYFDRPTVRDVFLKWRLRYEERGWSTQDMLHFLKKEGVTHLLLSDPLPQETSGTKSLLRSLAESEAAQELKRVESENIRDAKVRYALYEIVPSE